MTALLLDLSYQCLTCPATRRCYVIIVCNVRYAINVMHDNVASGPDVDAMIAIAKAYKERSLSDFQAALTTHSAQLMEDPIVRAHLSALYDTLLEVRRRCHHKVEHTQALWQNSKLLLDNGKSPITSKVITSAEHAHQWYHHMFHRSCIFRQGLGVTCHIWLSTLAYPVHVREVV